MKDFVIDANVIISILISGKSSYKPILTFFNLYTPDFALEEIEKYKSVIFQKSKFKKQELQEFGKFIFTRISVFPRFVISDDAINKASELTKEVDIKDISYVALTIELDCILLTRDKELLKGVRKKGFRKIILFDDFLADL